MDIVDKILEGIGMNNKKMQRKVQVRFPDWSGDTSRSMTIQELKDKHSECMLIDPRYGKQIDILDLTDLDRGIEEVVAFPAIRGG